ncbi:MAG: hypothetical protein ACK2T3_13580 [Candidatus Promineifilaceae bacterium]
MNDKISKQHIDELASSYVLDLLADELRPNVASHIAECSSCRERILAEKQIGALVSCTIRALDADRARLQSLMPAIPTRKSKGILSTPLFQQVAFAAVIMLFFLAGLNILWNQDISGLRTPESTALVRTASGTGTPTIDTLPPTPSLSALETESPVSSKQSFNPPVVAPAPVPLEVQQ